MIRSLLVLLFVLPALTSAQTRTEAPVPQVTWTPTMLVGEATPKLLATDPFASWFAPTYQQYQPDTAALARLKAELCDVELTVFLGTWCGDSKREVPRLCRALDALGYDSRKLRLVCVTPNKQAPNGEHQPYNIHHVPTVVASRKGILLGRIIERPVASLEADLLKIVTGQAYRPNYFVCELVDDVLRQQGSGYLAANAPAIADDCRPHVASYRELNTMGNVLWNANRWDDAVAVFALNTQIFPNDTQAKARLTQAQAEHPTRR